jgi:hypothetical protein
MARGNHAHGRYESSADEEHDETAGQVTRRGSSDGATHKPTATVTTTQTRKPAAPRMKAPKSTQR